MNYDKLTSDVLAHAIEVLSHLGNISKSEATLALLASLIVIAKDCDFGKANAYIETTMRIDRPGNTPHDNAIADDDYIRTRREIFAALELLDAEAEGEA